MATTYKAKAQRVCFKQHTCLACGSVYRYRFTRSVEASAATQQAAQVEADKKLQTALDTTFDPRPCPVCGLIQPEMVGQERADKHGCMLGLAFLLVMLLGFLFNGDYVGYRTLMAIAFLTSLYMTLKHIAAALHNPNNDLAANKVKAAEDVKAGTTALIEQHSDPKIDCIPTEISSQMKLAFLLLLGSLILLPFAELIRIPAGWGYNDHSMPPGAKDQYLFFWWAGMLGGIALQFVAGFMLNSKAESLKKGLGAQLIPIA